MKFTIEKSVATKALEMTAKHVSQKNVVPILSTIYVKAFSDGRVQFSATNFESSIRVTVQAKVEEEGECCIDNMISSLIANFDSGDISFSKGKGRVSIVQKNRKHHIGFLDSSDFPEFKEVSDYAPIDISTLAKAVSSVSIAASNDTSRQILQTCCINKDSVVCADGLRLAKFDLPLPGKTTNIPAKTLASFLSSGVRNESNVEAIFDTWSGIRGENWEVIFSSVEGRFPDFTSFVKKFDDPLLTLVVNREEFIRKLRICNLYVSKGDDPFVKLTKEGDKVFLSMSVIDVGDMREDIEDFKYEGDDLKIYFKPEFVISALSTFSSDYVEMSFKSYKSHFFITSPDNSELLHVIMPGLVSEESRQTKEDQDEADF